MWINALLGTLAIGALVVVATSGRFNDLVFIKKNNGFRVDVNKAIDQLSPSAKKLFQSGQNVDQDLIQKLENKISELENKASSLNIDVSAASGNANLWLVGLSIFLGLSLIFVFSRYSALQKTFDTLLNVTKNLATEQKKKLTLIKKSKSSAIALKESHENAINCLKNNTQAIKAAALNDMKKNKAAAAVFMDKYKTTIKASTKHYLDKNLKISLDRFNTYQKTSIVTTLSKLHNKFISDRTFDNVKHIPSYLIYASLSLVVIYSFLEIGLNSEFANEFVKSVNDGCFFSYGDYSSTFHMKDLEHNFNDKAYIDINHRLNFKSATEVSEKFFKAFDKSSKKKILTLES